MDSKQLNAASFGRAAQAYERGRPPYPESAIDWLLPDGAEHVTDLGAGTGKLTRQLLARGLSVVAVEPSDGMRQQLVAVIPGARALAGSGERIPLPDHIVDAVLAAQAWHWVDPVKAIPEVARVLRPGGRLGLMWNRRDEHVSWVAELGGILRSFGEVGTQIEMTDAEASDLGPLFGPVERFEVGWAHDITPAILLDLVLSRSYVITASADRRNALMERVRELLATDQALGGREQFPMPYLTRCFRADLVQPSDDALPRTGGRLT